MPQFQFPTPAAVLRDMALNWKAGLTVALVSLPLSVSIAIASGASPVQGIITAIWAGLIAAFFSGSNYNIVGPAGALSAILSTYALINGAGALSLLAILAGGLILAAGALNLDKYITYIPGSVVHGFALSVAIVIGLNQLNFALGLSGLPKHSEFYLNVLESLKHIGNTQISSAVFFAVSLAFLLAAAKYFPKVPGAVVLAPVAILLGALAKLGIVPVTLITLGDLYPNLSLALPFFQLPTFTFDKSVIAAAFTVALVAILETEISAKMADVMTKTKHNRRKEVFGLGLANIGSGLFGGLPATGVFVRTSMNVRSGATSRMAQGINAIAVAIVSFLLLHFFSYIPMGAIAATLVFAAIRMVEVKHLKRMFTHDKTSFAIAMGVAVISVYEDAMMGILAGTLISLVLMVENISKGQFEVIVNKDKKIVHRITGQGKDMVQVGDAHVVVYSIKGNFTYINAHMHLERLEHIMQGADAVVLRLRELTAMDLEGVEAFDEILEKLEAHGKDVMITGVNPLIAGRIGHSKHFAALKERGAVYERTEHALQSLT